MFRLGLRDLFLVQYLLLLILYFYLNPYSSPPLQLKITLKIFGSSSI